MTKSIFGFNSNSNVFGSKPARDKRRAFNSSQKKAILSKQGGSFVCARCHKRKDIDIAEHHHVRDWAKGGKTKTKNGRAVCPDCHRKIHQQERAKKSDKVQRKTTTNPLGFSISKAPKYKLPNFRL